MSLVSLTRSARTTRGGLQLLNVGPAGRRLIGLALSARFRLEPRWPQLLVPHRPEAAATRDAGHPLTAAVQPQIQTHALETGFSRGFLVSRR